MERKTKNTINNQFYDDLNELWRLSHDHPIALLRAENLLRNPWIQKELSFAFSYPCKFLDVGCGAGFLTNYLAQQGHLVSGIDLSEKSLIQARSHDTTTSVDYRQASAYQLPYSDASFDAVSAMDLLEHVEEPHLVIGEASRVLKTGGLFFFHTFNRNWLSYFMIIKGVEWCFSNAPPKMHVYPLFIKPNELQSICINYQLKTLKLKGIRPDFNRSAFWKMVFLKKVEKDFRFVFTNSLQTGYCGVAVKSKT